MYNAIANIYNRVKSKFFLDIHPMLKLLVNRACAPHFIHPNVSYQFAVVDFLKDNNAQCLNGLKYIIKTINDRPTHISLLAIDLLECCINNVGYAVIIHLSHRDMLNYLVSSFPGEADSKIASNPVILQLLKLVDRLRLIRYSKYLKKFTVSFHEDNFHILYDTLVKQKFYYYANSAMEMEGVGGRGYGGEYTENHYSVTSFKEIPRSKQFTYQNYLKLGKNMTKEEIKEIQSVELVEMIRKCSKSLNTGGNAKSESFSQGGGNVKNMRSYDKKTKKPDRLNEFQKANNLIQSITGYDPENIMEVDYIATLTVRENLEQVEKVARGLMKRRDYSGKDAEGRPSKRMSPGSHNESDISDTKFRYCFCKNALNNVRNLIIELDEERNSEVVVSNIVSDSCSNGEISPSGDIELQKQNLCAYSREIEILLVEVVNTFSSLVETGNASPPVKSSSVQSNKDTLLIDL